MSRLDDEVRRTEWYVHPERVQATREMERREREGGPWWGGILPITVAIIVIAVLCALYASVMML